MAGARHTEVSTITASPYGDTLERSPVPPLLWATGLAFLWAIFASGLRWFPYLTGEDQYSSRLSIIVWSAPFFALPALTLGQLLLAARHRYLLAKIVGAVAIVLTGLAALGILLWMLYLFSIWGTGGFDWFAILVTGALMVCLPLAWICQVLGWRRSEAARRTQR